MAAEATHQVKALISQTRSELTDDRHPAVRRDRRRSASRRADQGHLARGVRRLRPTLTRRPRPDAVGDVEHVYTFLFTAELLEANSMPLIGRSKAPRPSRRVTRHAPSPNWSPLSGPTRDRAAAATGRNVTTQSSSPRCCPVCGPRNSSTATSATSRRIDDDGVLHVLHVRGKGTRTAEYPSPRTCSTSSTTAYEHIARSTPVVDVRSRHPLQRGEVIQELAPMAMDCPCSIGGQVYAPRASIRRAPPWFRHGDAKSADRACRPGRQ